MFYIIIKNLRKPLGNVKRSGYVVLDVYGMIFFTGFKYAAQVLAQRHHLYPKDADRSRSSDHRPVDLLEQMMRDIATGEDEVDLMPDSFLEVALVVIGDNEHVAGESDHFINPV
jgi:hypothetical protein